MQQTKRRTKSEIFLDDNGFDRPDKEIVFNVDDPDLQPIHVPLPEMPIYYMVDGWNRKSHDQYFRKQTIPAKLLKIQKESETLDEMWDKFERNKANLRDEIQWLKLQWHRRLNGYWFMNCGKPTFITGTHYYYLNFYHIDDSSGLPQYRDRTRKRYIFLDFALNYTFDFKEKVYDKDGSRLPNQPGDELEDIGRRMLFGVIEPKMRRAGATNESLCWLLERATRNMVKHTAIQSIDETHSARAYKKILSAFKKTPFFFVPDYSRHFETSLKFEKKVAGGVAKDTGLESKITSATTSSCYHYDGEAIFDFLFDEPGKLVADNLYQGWQIIKNTLGRGSGAVISGFAMFPSTAGEYEKEGGENFFYLIKDSNYYERTANGQTKSGLVTLFLPAYEGLEGFIDRYGNSVIDTPTPEQARFIHRKIGAKEFLLNEREHFLKQGTPESIAKYREQQRLFPMCIREAFISDGTSIGFNEIILDSRIAELRFNQSATVRGNFRWESGRDSRVIFDETPSGKWIVSKLLPDGKNNLKYYKDGMWWPVDRKFAMHCADPFNFDETEGARMSKGGILGLERHNPTIDPQNKSIKDWQTPRIMCSYSYRESDTESFAEDCLMQTVYYGGLMNPESNNELVRKHFKRRGYGGYLYYMHDDKGGYRSTAGYHLRINADKMLGLAADFIERHGHKCDHIEVLKQCKELRGKKDITNKDLVAVLGGALLGVDDDYSPVTEIENKGTDIGWIFRRY